MVPTAARQTRCAPSPRACGERVGVRGLFNVLGRRVVRRLGRVLTRPNNNGSRGTLGLARARPNLRLASTRRAIDALPIPQMAGEAGIEPARTRFWRPSLYR